MYSLVLERIDEGAPIDFYSSPLMFFGKGDPSIDAEVGYDDKNYRVTISKKTGAEKFKEGYILLVENDESKSDLISEKKGGVVQMEYYNRTLEEVLPEFLDEVVKIYVDSLTVRELRS